MQPKVINQQQKLKVSVEILSLNNWETNEMHNVDQKLALLYELFQLLPPKHIANILKTENATLTL